MTHPSPPRTAPLSWSPSAAATAALAADAGRAAIIAAINTTDMPERYRLVQGAIENLLDALTALHCTIGGDPAAYVNYANDALANRIGTGHREEPATQ